MRAAEFGAWARRTGRRILGDGPVGKLIGTAYERYLTPIDAGKGLPWQLNGTTYRIDPGHRRHIPHVYDDDVFGFLRDKIKPGQVCYNVGANIGVYALELATMTGPGGQVVAFEPNPQATEVLRRHIAYNGLEQRVVVEPTAVSDAPGSMSLFFVEADPRTRLGQPNPDLADEAEEVTVAVVTLDDYASSAGVVPDWIFIDIEGFEIQALRGAASLVRHSETPPRFVVEMHPNVWSLAGKTRADAESVLADLGLQMTALSGQADPLEEYGHVLLTVSEDSRSP